MNTNHSMGAGNQPTEETVCVCVFCCVNYSGLRSHYFNNLDWESCVP